MAPRLQRGLACTLNSFRTNYNLHRAASISQLMNNRVASAGCSIAPQSNSGIKQEASSTEQPALRFIVSTIAGFNSHKIRIAAFCPKGNNRWQAETKLAAHECKNAKIARSSSTPNTPQPSPNAKL